MNMQLMNEIMNIKNLREQKKIDNKISKLYNEEKLTDKEYKELRDAITEVVMLNHGVSIEEVFDRM